MNNGGEGIALPFGFCLMPSRIRPFLIVGHRGAPLLAPPGNTVASLQKAVEVGAQMLEVDVRRTRDDVLVLDHDAVRHVAGQETPISAQSYAQWEGTSPRRTRRWRLWTTRSRSPPRPASG